MTQVKVLATKSDILVFDSLFEPKTHIIENHFLKAVLWAHLCISAWTHVQM